MTKPGDITLTAPGAGAPSRASAPQTIGRFAIEREAGAGSMGTIYRAHDVATGEVVAVKLFRGLTSDDATRFEREGRVLAQIRHPGVVRHVEHGTTELGDAYLAMEWLEGEDARSRLSRGRLTVEESVTLGRRVAGALAAVHAHGLVHRDVKPGNLFLPAARVEDAKLIDFGLARSEKGSIGPTRTGAMVGTPAYMAPEQARGARDVDARADVYSLGCVLFRCLTGRAPFEGGILAVLTKVLVEEPPPLTELVPEAPAALADLLARMLAKDPCARPESAAVLDALAALAPPAGPGDAVEPAPPGTRPERRVAVLLVGVDAGAEPEPDGDVDAIARAHGAQIDRLLDGTRVVAILGPAVATEQAARAARCALSVRAALPGAPMALAIGRLPVDDAVERAAQMLGERRSAPASIAIDPATAALLDPRFEVSDGDEGPSLSGMREVGSAARPLRGTVG